MRAKGRREKAGKGREREGGGGRGGSERKGKKS